MTCLTYCEAALCMGYFTLEQKKWGHRVSKAVKERVPAVRLL